MLFYLLIFLYTVSPSYQSPEKKLVEHLLQNASRSTRPVLNSSSPVIVKLGFELVHIVTIIESEQKMNAKVWLRMEWVNEMMRWNPDEWGNIKKTRLDYNLMWTPDIFLTEDVSQEISTGPSKYKTQIGCEANGRQQWLVPTLLTSSCKFNIKYFPYDRQQCHLRFISWAHSQKELDLELDSRPVVDVTNYINSPEWLLVSVTSEKNVKHYNCCPDPFVDILYTLTIDRRPRYYVYNAIIPCIIQMMIILFTFFLPVESGERIGVVITVLLVFAVYLEIVSGKLPKTSSSIPTLSLYYIWSMAASSCSLIATCIVLFVHFRGSEKGAPPIPELSRKLLYGKMGRMFGVRENVAVSDGCTQALFTRHKNVCYNNVPQENGSRPIAVKDGVNMDMIGTGNECSVTEISRLIDEIRLITKKFQDQEESDTIENEWRMLAKVLDRIFFFIFMFIFIVLTLAILLPAYIHYTTYHSHTTHLDSENPDEKYL